MGFLSVLINPLILITSILLSLMIVYIFYAHYLPYFFPNLDENKDINQIIINDRTYKQKLLLIKEKMVNHSDKDAFKRFEQLILEIINGKN